MNAKSAVTAEEQEAVVQSLERLLSESYALMAQTHLAHWNVEGTDFFQLHTAFQTQYEELFEAIDGIAEHIRALDAYAPGGLAMLAEKAPGIPAMERRLSGKEYVAGLVEGHESIITLAKTGAEQAATAGDIESEDLFIERLRSHEKTLWMLKSYLK